MNLEINEIYTFKLNSSEELVVKVVDQFADYIVIANPIAAVLTPQGLQLMPCMFSSNMDKNVQLNKNSIAMVAEPRDDIRSKYIEATTGLVTAPASKQIITG